MDRSILGRALTLFFLNMSLVLGQVITKIPLQGIKPSLVGDVRLFCFFPSPSHRMFVG